MSYLLFRETIQLNFLSIQELCKIIQIHSFFGPDKKTLIVHTTFGINFYVLFCDSSLNILNDLTCYLTDIVFIQKDFKIDRHWLNISVLTCLLTKEIIILVSQNYTHHIE